MTEIKTAQSELQIANTDIEATILAGQTVSDSVDCYGMTVLGFEMPAAWTAADITFLTSNDGITYQAHNVGSSTSVPLQISVAASNNYTLQQAVYLAGFRFIKVVSSAPQVADRVIKLAVRPV